VGQYRNNRGRPAANVKPASGRLLLQNTGGPHSDKVEQWPMCPEPQLMDATGVPANLPESPSLLLPRGICRLSEIGR